MKVVNRLHSRLRAKAFSIVYPQKSKNSEIAGFTGKMALR